MKAIGLAFNTESRFWKWMDILGDLVRLNLLFILTSLPVVTIGASLTAMYSVLFKMREKRDGKLVQQYFAAWKENWKESTFIWVLYMAFLGTVAIQIFRGSNQGISIMYIFLGILLAVISMTVFYSFAMLARFQNTLADTIVKAAIIASAGLPYTLVMALMAAALVILTIQSYLSILIMASFWLLFGFSLVAYVDVIFYLRVFRRFTAKEDLPKEEEGQLSATPEF